jgi:hypothetical protein
VHNRQQADVVTKLSSAIYHLIHLLCEQTSTNGIFFESYQSKAEYGCRACALSVSITAGIGNQQYLLCTTSTPGGCNPCSSQAEIGVGVQLAPEALQHILTGSSGHATLSNSAFGSCPHGQQHVSFLQDR